MIHFLKHKQLLIMPRKYIKLLVLLAAVALTAIAVFELHESYVERVEYEFYRQHIGPNSVISAKDASQVCHLPVYDPFDPTILRYIKKWPPIACGNPQYPLTFMDHDGVIHLNGTAIKEAGLEEKEFHCALYEVLRKPNDDDHYELGPPKVFTAPIKVDYEYIVVRCYESSNHHRVYESGHAQIVPLPENVSAKSRKANENGGVNVLFMVLDSMSRLNFIRQLPKTYAVLVDVLKASVMKGLTKVGDNTYPNMVVMLTGLASSRNQMDKTLGPFWGNRNASRGHFDHLPAAWKNFSSQGYVTMFAEDLPEYSIFNYMAHGFHNPPTNYYMRPFWLAMDRQKKLKSKDNRCYGNIPKYQYIFNYTEEFLQKMRKGKNAYFAFSFLTHLSHDSINSVQVVDEDFARLLTHLHVTGALENTVLIVMGDHGNRFDAIRKTVIGRVEERMPFFSISLPKKLHHLKANVEANSNILISWHDVYEMLMDLAMDNLKPISKKVRFGHRGLSLFRPIPSNRTCHQIGIPNEYCVCWIEKELDPQESRAMSAAKVMIDHVNTIIKKQENLCSLLELDKVWNAQLLLPAEHVAAPSDLAVLLRVTASVKPSGALLEATLERRAWSREDRVLGDVNRINRYGNQSLCVDDNVLKLYCYCKINPTVS